MSNKSSEPKRFWDLTDEDKDLTMFTITKLNLSKEENRNMVSMAIKLKRKVATELLTTYLPTILLLLISFTTTFFDKNLFGDNIAVNLTIMLVMTTIFTSKIEELPPTSDMKMIDIWLIFCLVVPFLEVILRTTIECVNCSCSICEPEEVDKETKAREEDQKRGGDLVQGGSSGVWVLTGAKVAPQQVIAKDQQHKEEEKTESKPKKENTGGKCWTGTWRRTLEITGFLVNQRINHQTLFCKNNFSESWALPITVLFAAVAYAAVAAIFYNRDA